MGQQNGWGEEGRIAEVAEEGQEVEEKMEVGAEENGGGRFFQSEFEDGGAEQQEKETVQKAAAVLARIPSLFSDFCEPCSALLLSRLSDLASGNFVSSKPVLEPSNEVGSRKDWEEVGVDGSSMALDHAQDLLPGNPSVLRDNNGTLAPAENSTADEDVKPTLLSKQLSAAERERRRLLGIRRKKDFVCLERIDGRVMNVAEGLELHTGVFSAAEQRKLVSFIHELQAKGRNQELKERTYSEPRKWMRGKGRVTIQFGCCYNYASDRLGNPPGILRDDVVDPLPQLLRISIKRLVKWHVLPPTCVPDSCIINIYEEGDCIPPHIDHHDFLRPFCTVSLLSECNIVFGANLKIVGPGEFDGRLLVPLPVGSVLVLKGNGADVAKHAVPAVPTERISITFRKMDPKKVPDGFSQDEELLSIRPAILPSPISGKEPSLQRTASSGVGDHGNASSPVTITDTTSQADDNTVPVTRLEDRASSLPRSETIGSGKRVSTDGPFRRTGLLSSQISSS